LHTPTRDKQTTGPRILAVILARAGSKGLPGKHTRMLLGKPVIAYTIEAALASRTIDEIILTSDDPQVIEIAMGYGIRTTSRPVELASDSATVDAAARHACDQMLAKHQFQPDLIAILYGNIPIRPSGLIDLAVSHLLEKGGDSVQSYSPVGKMHPDWMVRLNDDRVVLNCDKPIYRRQDLRPMFIPNGAVIVVTRESLYRPPTGPEDFHAFLGRDRRGVVHPRSDCIVDIDEAKDLHLAEAVLRSLQEETADETRLKKTSVR